MALKIDVLTREEPLEKPPTTELTPMCRVAKTATPTKATSRQGAPSKPRIHNNSYTQNIPFKKYIANVYDRANYSPNSIIKPLGAIFDTTLSRAHGQASTLYTCTGSEFIEVLETKDPYYS